MGRAPEWGPTVGSPGGKKGTWTRKKIRQRRALLAVQKGTTRAAKRASREAKRQKLADATIHSMGRVQSSRRDSA